MQWSQKRFKKIPLRYHRYRQYDDIVVRHFNLSRLLFVRFLGISSKDKSSYLAPHNKPVKSSGLWNYYPYA